jgi:predicted kinase
MSRFVVLTGLPASGKSTLGTERPVGFGALLRQLESRT